MTRLRLKRCRVPASGAHGEFITLSATGPAAAVQRSATNCRPGVVRRRRTVDQRHRPSAVGAAPSSTPGIGAAGDTGPCRAVSSRATPTRCARQLTRRQMRARKKAGNGVGLCRSAKLLCRRRRAPAAAHSSRVGGVATTDAAASEPAVCPITA